MKMTFSVNLYDNDGDVVEECFLLHMGNDTILKVKNIAEIQTMVGNLNNIIDEIQETYGTE